MCISHFVFFLTNDITCYLVYIYFRLKKWYLDKKADLSNFLIWTQNEL